MNDLDIVRGFRSSLAEPAPQVSARIEEAVWQQVLAAERARGRSRRRWAIVFTRRMVAASLAVSVATAFSMLGTQTTRPSTAGFQTENAAAGLLHSTASNLLTTEPSTPAASYAPPGGAAYQVAPVAIEQASRANPDGAAIAAGPTSMRAADMVEQVPADPEAVLAALRATTAGVHAADRDYEPLRVTARYLADPQVPASVRATFFRVLALLDGVDGGTTAVDVLGRAGVVIARIDARSGVRQQLLVDPQTALLLEHREFTTRDAGAGCPAGSIVTLDAYDGGFVVTPASAPYANWPQVAADCAP